MSKSKFFDSLAPKQSRWAVPMTLLCVAGLVILVLFGVFSTAPAHRPADLTTSSEDSEKLKGTPAQAFKNHAEPLRSQPPHNSHRQNNSNRISSVSPKYLLTSSSSGKAPEYLGGQVANAIINASGKEYKLTPNQTGNFGRVVIDSRVKVLVHVSYPQASAGDNIQIESEDGGVLDTGEVVKTGALDSEKSIEFHFVSGLEEGIYRITLRQGSDLKQIDFWVGPEFPVRKLNVASGVNN